MATHTRRVSGVAAPWSTARVSISPPNLRTIMPTAASGIGMVTGLAAPWSWHDQTPAQHRFPSMGRGEQRGLGQNYPTTADSEPGATLGPRHAERQEGDRQHESIQPLPYMRNPWRQPDRLHAAYGRPRLGPGQRFAALQSGHIPLGLTEPPPMLALPAGRPTVPLVPSGGAARKLLPSYTKSKDRRTSGDDD